MSDFYATDANAPAATPNLPLIHWVDTTQLTRDPVPAQTLLGWIDAGHLPADTPAWWDGLDGWTTAVELRAIVAPQAGPAAEPALDAQPTAGETQPTAELAGPADENTESTAEPAATRADGDEPAGQSQWTRPTIAPGADATDPPRVEAMPAASLTEHFDDQDLDDTFMDLVERSSEIYKESERATSMDEVFLGGVIAAFGDSGFVLIDLLTGGSLRSSGSSSTAQVAVPINRHELRFEDPTSGARVSMVLDHLTPDAGSAKVLGQRARIQLGYGQRVPNFGQVGRALRQEMASTFVVSPEPGRVTFDADLSSGFVYCLVDLLWELDRYVDDGMDVDADLLRKHLAANVHTLRKFLQLRFAG